MSISNSNSEHAAALPMIKTTIYRSQTLALTDTKVPTSMSGSHSKRLSGHLATADSEQIAIHAASLPDGLSGAGLEIITSEEIKEHRKKDNESDDDSDNNTEPVDPRVEGLLEAMTDAMEMVNINENLYNQAKRKYSHAIMEGDRKIKEVLRRSGVRSAVNKTTDYFNAWQILTQRHEEAHELALMYEQCQNELETAKNMEAACEQSMLEELRNGQAQVDGKETDEQSIPGLISHATQVKLNNATDEVNRCKTIVERKGRQFRDNAEKVKVAQRTFHDLRQKAMYDPIYGLRVDKAQQYFVVKKQVQKDINAVQNDLSSKNLSVEKSRNLYKQAALNIEALTIEIRSAKVTPIGSPKSGRGTDLEGCM
eukprot:CFRG1000T1